MNHLPFTLVAYFFNALAVLSSKFLLTKTIPDPLIYIFYISLFSFLAVLALPFTHIPTLQVFNLASFSTILWTAGAYFMFKALKIGSVSRVIPIIGTLIPLILLVFAAQTNTITPIQTWAVWFLVSGMVFLTMPDWRARLLTPERSDGGQGSLSKKELVFELLSAAFFAFSYIILRQAYLLADFFSVLVWSRLILLPLGIIMFLIPTFRKKIIASKGPTNLLFLGGQISGAASEILLLFSISLANPALVNSLQGTQYIFLLFFGLFFFKEKYNLPILLSKLTGIVLIGLGLYLLTSPL